MAIRLLKASTYYQDYLEAFQAQHSELRSVDYTGFSEALFADCFSWSNFWKLHLEKTNQFIVTEVVINSPAQRLWAKEHGLKHPNEISITEILAAQIEAFRPDVVFLHDNTLLNSSFRDTLKHRFPFIRILIGYDGINACDPIRYRASDLMLACSPRTADFYRSNGARGHYMKQGFEAGLAERFRLEPRQESLSFVGSVGLGPQQHNARVALLHSMLCLPCLKLHLNIAPWSSTFKSLIKRSLELDFAGASKIASSIPHYLALMQSNQGPVFGKSMYEILSSSQISLNFHIDAAGQVAGNMRMFEVTGMGSCLLTDYKENLSQFFDLDEEIVCFRSTHECLEKAKYLIEHPHIAQKIAAKGQAKTLRDHRLSSEIESIGVKIQEML